MSAKKVAEAAENTVEKKTTKKAAPKAEGEAKKTVRRTRKVAATTYVEFAGAQYVVSDLTEKVTAAFEAEGNKASAIKTLDIYVKPEEGKAYYVINGEADGKSVDL